MKISIELKENEIKLPDNTLLPYQLESEIVKILEKYNITKYNFEESNNKNTHTHIFNIVT